jgi:hypothetical protein
MKTSRAGLLSLLVVASVLLLGCGKSGHTVAHDGSEQLSDSADAPLGLGGGTAGAGGTLAVGAGGTGGAIIGTGGVIVGTGGTTASTGGTFAGTGGATVSTGGSGGSHDPPRASAWTWSISRISRAGRTASC